MAEHRESFNLVDEPWILVVDDQGAVRELSIRSVFAEAEHLMSIVGEVPTQTFAILRVLLAILHRSVRPVRDPDSTWAELWSSPAAICATVDRYLVEHADAFDLLDPERPFFQVAGLETVSGDVSSLDKILVDVPNGAPYFTTRAGLGIESIDFAEAARWLIHCQAFDPSGIKSGVVDDPRNKGGKGYPIGVAWSGMLGGLVVEGRNVRETLLLNLVLADHRREPYPDDDLPVWERGPLKPGEENRIGAPTGPVDLQTWPSRRIRLVHDGIRVTGVVIGNGDPLKPQGFDNLRNQEAMTAWRRSEAQERLLKRKPVYMPNTHHPDRVFWRGLPALLPIADRDGQATGGAPLITALNIEWIRHLCFEDIIDKDFVIRVRAIGLEYGPQSATVAEIVDEALTIDSVLLAERGRAISEPVLVVVAETERAVQQLAILSRNLAVAKGGDPDGAGDRAREAGYFGLDEPFRRWLSGLAAGSDMNLEVGRWRQTARNSLIALGDRAVEDSGPSAWRGRPNPRDKEKQITAPQAFGWFLKEIYSILPGPPDSTGEPVRSGDREEQGNDR